MRAQMPTSFTFVSLGPGILLCALGETHLHWQVTPALLPCGFWLCLALRKRQQLRQEGDSVGRSPFWVVMWQWLRSSSCGLSSMWQPSPTVTCLLLAPSGLEPVRVSSISSPWATSLVILGKLLHPSMPYHPDYILSAILSSSLDHCNDYTLNFSLSMTLAAAYKF